MKSSRNPIISVVVAAYNEEKYIRRCIESLLNQKIEQPYEIIICDNKSKDRTPSIAKSYPVRVFQAAQKGNVHALRKGIKQTRGKYIAITDADTIVNRQWLKRIVQAFQSQPNVVGIGGPYNFYDGPLLVRGFVRFINWLNPKLLTASLCGMNMAFRKSIYDQIGGFDKNIVLQADTNLGYKLEKQGTILYLRNNPVLSSARRYNSLGQITKELLIRLTNVVTLKLFQKTLFRKFHDFR